MMIKKFKQFSGLSESRKLSTQEKLDAILQFLNSQDNGSSSNVDEFNGYTDEQIDKMYKDIYHTNEEFFFFKTNKEQEIRVIDTNDNRDLTLKFTSLKNRGRGLWRIEFDDPSMEYGYGHLIYNQLTTEVEEIVRYGYERQIYPPGIEITDDTINDLKKIIRKNK